MKLNCLFVFVICFNVVIATGHDDYLEAQSSVTSPIKERALYMTIYIKSCANALHVAKVIANLQSHVNRVSPPQDVTELTEMSAGAGFGEEFYRKISNNSLNFTFIERRGHHGVIPATGGDIFIHAKSNSHSKLFELAQEILRRLPKFSVKKFEDIHTFMFNNNRDLSGFFDGTESPKTFLRKQEVAVIKDTGGTFAITQKWIHDMELIEETHKSKLERIIGRTIDDDIIIRPVLLTSHISRMVGATAPFKKHEVVRQSLPFGDLHSGCGLYYLAYAISPEVHDFMLDNMVGIGESPVNDELMTFSKPVSGNYWYFPGSKEMEEYA